MSTKTMISARPATMSFNPSCGAITLFNVTATYRRGLDPTLKGVSVDIDGASFVGICGRTGSGKSTLFLSLLRLIPWRGTIIIDGVDIRTVNRKALRQAITSVPQDPVLFSGTLRQNVDIFGEMSDEAVWSALENAYFTRVMGSCESGLDSEVTAGGANWSSGEKQMICFARAILRRNKILLLDEATSSLDATTDKLIQMTLRKVFKGITRLVIAHRLETIADADQIIVVDGGQLILDGGKEFIAEKMGKGKKEQSVAPSPPKRSSDSDNEGLETVLPNQVCDKDLPQLVERRDSAPEKKSSQKSLRSQSM